jgi:peptidoglycan/xylan/chitin deacetylase (PgdA/CDA1 family)
MGFDRSLILRLRFPGIIVGFVLITGFGALMFQPHWIVAQLSNLNRNILYTFKTDEKVVALTIDDGPDPETTPRILETLRRHDASATFFLLSDRVAGSEAAVRQIVAEGHEIGNHLTDDEPSILFEGDEFERRLSEAHAVLSPFAGLKWFRPGSGWLNAGMVDTVEKHGYRIALGSIYPFDSQIPSSWFASQYILWRVNPGAVIVLHDDGERGERTIETLSYVLPILREQGYRVRSLSAFEDKQLQR